MSDEPADGLAQAAEDFANLGSLTHEQRLARLEQMVIDLTEIVGKLVDLQGERNDLDAAIVGFIERRSKRRGIF